MKIDYEGTVYEFDVTRLSVEECEAIEKFVPARGLGEWSNLLAVANTKALRALWWVIRRHAGEDAGPSPAAPAPGFLPLALNHAYAEAEAAAAAEALAAAEAEEAEADPTRPAGSSPGPAATTTTPASDAATPSLPG